MTITKPDCGPAAIFDTIWMAGKALAEDVVKPTTMSLPKACTVPPAARSDDIAPLNAYRLGSLTTPFWNSAAPATLISYQLTCEPPPPNTACDVHKSAVAEVHGVVQPEEKRAGAALVRHEFHHPFAAEARLRVLADGLRHVRFR